MTILIPALLTVLISSVSCWDCYDQKCRGTGDNTFTSIFCDQEFNHCVTDFLGYPECEHGYSGEGVDCWVDNGSYTCESYTYYFDGKAYCDYSDDTDDTSTRTPIYAIVPSVSGAIFVILLIISVCIRYSRRRRFAVQRRVVVIQQRIRRPDLSTAVGGSNVTPAQDQPTPAPPYYEPTGHLNPGYVAQQGEFEQPPPSYDEVATPALPDNDFPTNV